MPQQLFYNTVTPLLHTALKELMQLEVFSKFRLVGGTSLSLQYGHRMSVDIDLFTDAEYGSINFKEIDKCLDSMYGCVQSSDIEIISFGKSYRIGASENQLVKLDLFYTDAFIRPIRKVDEIRLADTEDIIAMKIDVISRAGRKKDFWDLHELLDNYSIEKMIELHEERYPYTHNRNEILTKLTNFDNADEDLDPICIRGKYWELIKLDFVELMENKS